MHRPGISLSLAAMADQNDSARGPLPPFRGWQPSSRPGSRTILRLLLLIAAGAVALAALVAAILLLALPRPTHQVPALTAQAVAPESSRSFTVVSGEVMSTLLRRAGLVEPVAGRVIQALKLAEFNFRRMKPGDSLILFFRADTLFRLHYQQSYEQVYRVDLNPAGYRVSMPLRFISTVQDTLLGTIKSSLYESVLALGEKALLVSDYTDIFGWEIDFFSEVQEGDSFAILFERRLADSTPIGYGPILAARYKGQVGDLRGFRFTDQEGRTDYYNPEGQCLRKTFLKSPLQFSRISSFFGRRYHPIRHIRCPHNGIDYAAPTGTPVSCVADGRVISAGWNSGYGRLVVVSHANGFETRYGHLSGFGKGVKTGERVVQGQIIGYVGSTGLSTGPHLHYEVRKSGSPTNPLRLDPPRHEPVKDAFLPAFRALADSLQPALALSAPLPPPSPAPR